MATRRNAPLTAAEKRALRAILAKHNPKRKTKKRNPPQSVPLGKRNPKKKTGSVTIPRGKRHGDCFTRNGKKYMVISILRSGKRVRYARKC